MEAKRCILSYKDAQPIEQHLQVEDLPLESTWNSDSRHNCPVTNYTNPWQDPRATQAKFLQDLNLHAIFCLFFVLFQGLYMWLSAQ